MDHGSGLTVQHTGSGQMVQGLGLTVEGSLFTIYGQDVGSSVQGLGRTCFDVIKWIRTSRLSIKNSLSLGRTCLDVQLLALGRRPHPAEKESSLLTTFWSESNISS